ncbi:DciA family protein [Methylomonas montana]|uniref:DciA family protein n=1 Tax=Methylomonas montana TaxID=3058963 RepID=UPI0026589653|nr:DciA family protein [Methylomonas montana]WKJ90823.1 DciA family protein [Methylomonas montana]
MRFTIGANVIVLKTDMKKTGFKSALDFKNNQLASCLDKIAAQQALLGIVKSALPTDLAKHAVHCVASGSLLLLYSDSASWASQIRFFNRGILDKLHAAGQLHIVRLQVRIVAPQAEPLRPKRGARLPSAENIGLICDQANRADDQDVLGAALARLGAALIRRSGEG